MLNKSQEAAKAEIIKFLSGSQDILALNAPSGFGKTFLLNDIKDSMQKVNKRRSILGSDSLNEFRWAATTNKAASLINGETVFKTYGFSMFNDYSTGKPVVSTKKATHIHNSVINIDEASMLDSPMISRVKEYSPNCKLILIGDDCQLPPVGYSNIPAFDPSYKTITLTEPMRQDADSELYQLCLAMRKVVQTHQWTDITKGDGIEIVDAPTFLAMAAKAFQDGEDAKVIAYRNKQVIGYNNFIRKALNRPAQFVTGDIVTVRNFCFDIGKTTSTCIEDVHTIQDITTGGLSNEVPYNIVTLDGIPYRLPKDADHWRNEIKDAKSSEDWARFYDLQQNFIDLRAGYAATAHMAQGSTYDTVFIDLTDILTCTNRDTLFRMLYVAISRARTKVVIYGI